MTTQNTNGSNAATTIGIIIVVLLAVIAGAYFMDASRDNTKLDNAIEEFTDNAERGRISEGIQEGSEELRDRSTGEKIGDAIEDTGRDIQDAADDARE